MNNEAKLLAQLTKDKRLFHPAYIAYIMATVKHETAGRFEPVKEAFWLSEEWRMRNLRYYPYYGRGFVQITWEENYYKAQNQVAPGELAGSPGKSYEATSENLQLDLVHDPDLALRWDVAYEILVQGMLEGWFTGRRLSYFRSPDISSQDYDFVQARRIVNGMDRASLIAAYAEEYLIQIKDTFPLAPLAKPSEFAFTKGDSGSAVEVIQALLNLSMENEDETLAVDGIFGEITAQAVASFQRRNNLPIVTSEIRVEEWALLKELL